MSKILTFGESLILLQHHRSRATQLLAADDIDMTIRFRLFIISNQRSYYISIIHQLIRAGE